MNKATLLLLSVGAVVLPSLGLAQGDLSRYRDKNRLLLVFAPSLSDVRWKKQNALLDNSAVAFKDRDLLRFDYLEKGGTPGKALRLRYGVKPGQFRVLLIGKDGHVASEGPSPIGLNELTEQIDRMPMRRDEMRQRGR
ncbi:MAG: DUF4174 domain-containing protein [Janthinobacterium lividum]